MVEAALAISILSIIGSFMAWRLSKDDAEKALKLAHQANQNSNTANDLSNRANEIALLALKSENEKFKYTRLLQLAQKLKDFRRLVRVISYADPKLSDLMLEMLTYLSHVKDFDLVLFKKGSLKEQLIKGQQEARNLDQACDDYHIACEDVKQHGNNIMILLSSLTPKVAADLLKRKNSSTALRSSKTNYEKTLTKLFEMVKGRGRGDISVSLEELM